MVEIQTQNIQEFCEISFFYFPYHRIPRKAQNASSERNLVQITPQNAMFTIPAI